MQTRVKDATQFRCDSPMVPRCRHLTHPNWHNCSIVVSVSQIPIDAVRRAQRVQVITIVWMSVEAAISLLAAWRARSPALLAFGGDSVIELLSAVVVLWRFRTNVAQERAERLAARITGILLFALGGCVVVVSVMALLGYTEPKSTFLGIAVLIAAAAFMPLLAKEKRRLSAQTGSAALGADAAESALCAYLSLIALVGLAANAVWRVPWADSVAALAIVPVVLWEGREALRGKACGCH
jgi:divalent metal cation (Fe/Co/Zn/Cd) transporter